MPHNFRPESVQKTVDRYKGEEDVCMQGNAILPVTQGECRSVSEPVKFSQHALATSLRTVSGGQ
jgi:hypothetical protein